MSDLVQWLPATLDAREQEVRERHRRICGHDEVGPDWPCNCDDHVSFSLAEVDAKRRILDLHPHRRFATLPEEWPDHWKAEIKQAFPGTEQPYVGCEVDDFNSNYEVVEPGWWCPTVRLLALPFADREGFREEWKP